MIIDCDTCTVRGAACGDCVVGVLLGPPTALDAEEERALGVLADSGLIPPLRLVPQAHNPGEVHVDTRDSSSAGRAVGET